MNEQSALARRIAETIAEALAGADDSGTYAVFSRGCCSACELGTCPECGHAFDGSTVIIHHKRKGKRYLSDRAVHFLSHGRSSYQTKYVYKDQPVTVDLDLRELAEYLDLQA